MSNVQYAHKRRHQTKGTSQRTLVSYTHANRKVELPKNRKKSKKIFTLVGELKICLYVDERPKPHGKHYSCVKTNNITHVRADKAFILPLSFGHTRSAWSWGGSPGIEEEQEEYLKQQA